MAKSEGSRRSLNPWRRIAELEAEVQECRAVNLRVAELADVVTELLVPLLAEEAEISGDSARATRIRALLERYHGSL